MHLWNSQRHLWNGQVMTVSSIQGELVPGCSSSPKWTPPGSGSHDCDEQARCRRWTSKLWKKTVVVFLPALSIPPSVVTMSFTTQRQGPCGDQAIFVTGSRCPLLIDAADVRMLM